MKIKVKKLHPDAMVPRYAHKGDSGFDLHALYDYTIHQGQTIMVETGMAMSLEAGYELQIRPRSGLSLKTNLRVSNAPGTVDNSYRGPINVLLTNITPLVPGYVTEGIVIKKGDRIAQGVVCPVWEAEFEEVDSLDSTDRGAGGFGSSGT